MKISIVNNRTSLAVFIAYLLFFLSNYFYYSIFAVNYAEFWHDEQYSQFFYFPLNLDQEKAYVPHLTSLQNSEYLSISNTSGIAYVYWLLSLFLTINPETIPFVSFVINNLFVLASYYYFVKIGTEVLGLPLKYRWLFFLNPSLIYNSQLINKEMISLALILATTYYLAQKNFYKGVFVFSFSTIIRLHYSVLMPLTLFLVRKPEKFKSNLAILYVLSSLANAYLFVSPESNLDAYTSQGGLSQFILDLNKSCYIGSLLLNPLKVIQYFFELFSSFIFITEDFKLNLYNFHNVPYLVCLIILRKDLMRIFLNFRTFVHGPSIFLLAMISVFFLILLMSQIVVSRYLFPLSPLIVLLGIYSRAQHKQQSVNQKTKEPEKWIR